MALIGIDEFWWWDEVENNSKKKIIILAGPTAVGKTELSIRLAREIGAEIISADALQVYRGMDIGTAKITQDEMMGVRHHLIDIVGPEEKFNAAEFKKRAVEAIEEINGRGNIPMVVGGTGFYIQALLYDIDFDNKPNAVSHENINADYKVDIKDKVKQETQTCSKVPIKSVISEKNNKIKSNDNSSTTRAKLHTLYETNGSEYMHRLLEEVDAESAEKIHANNVQRVIRALEYYYETGERFSEYNKRQALKEPAFDYVYFCLNDDRERLYERIDKRVDIMFDNGLLDEMEGLLKLGLTRQTQSMQAIGYRELFDYFDGKAALDEVKDLIKLNSRHYAKRQLTWFRREKNVTWMDYTDYDYSKDEMLTSMIKQLKDNDII